jgi:type VI secretion system secreted protein VgrG
MPDITQDNRYLKLTTTLGKDLLLIESFTMSDRVSDPFELEVIASASPDKKIDPKAIIGEVITVHVNLGDQADSSKYRYLSGIVRELHIGGTTERFRSYRLSVVPTFWLLKLTENFRVFEKQTVVDIVKKILSEYGISPTLRLTRTYTKWDMLTQYRETDFHFVSRLMEHEGIFYFFEHTEGKHTLVLGDNPQAFQYCPDKSLYNYAPEAGPGGTDSFDVWERSGQLRTGSYALWDWHYENAPNRFTAESTTAAAMANNNKYKIAEFPGDNIAQFNQMGNVGGVPVEAGTLAKLRMEEIETENPSFRGYGSIRALNAGHRFSLEPGGDVYAEAGPYVATSTEHNGVQHPPYIGGEYETPRTYTTVITAMEHAKPFRPARRHKKPLAHGPQTALVTDRPDKYARVRVKYHWGGEQQPSAWVRVVQKWAGKLYGAQFIPRPGHEVVIEFENGDPDRPLITGCLYNKENMPPFTLPDKFTQSGIKTRSLTDRADGGNEGQTGVGGHLLPRAEGFSSRRRKRR